MFLFATLSITFSFHLLTANLIKNYQSQLHEMLVLTATVHYILLLSSFSCTFVHWSVV